MRLEQIAAVMEGDLGGEGGPAASTIMAVADAARMWNAGKGGAYYAPGRSLGLVGFITNHYMYHPILIWCLLSTKGYQHPGTFCRGLCNAGHHRASNLLGIQPNLEQASLGVPLDLHGYLHHAVRSLSSHSGQQKQCYQPARPGCIHITETSVY